MSGKRKRQTRRCISIRAEVHASIERHCHMRGVSVSSFVEAASINALTAAGAEMVPREEALDALRKRDALKPTAEALDTEARTHFSF